MEALESFGRMTWLYSCDPDLGCGWWGLIWLPLVLLWIVPWWRIWARTGHSGFWGVLVIVPLVNIVLFWVLAFKKWPALRGQEEEGTGHAT
jgi:hypothetical protein